MKRLIIATCLAASLASGGCSPQLPRFPLDAFNTFWSPADAIDCKGCCTHDPVLYKQSNQKRTCETECKKGECLYRQRCTTQ